MCICVPGTSKAWSLPPYHDGEAQVIIRRRNGREQIYDYAASLPYQRWMLEGRIEMREQVYGCVNCGEGEAEALLMPRVLPEFIPEYRLDTIAPEPEPVKVRAETRTARLQFRQDSYRIRPDYKNNRAEPGYRIQLHPAGEGERRREDNGHLHHRLCLARRQRGA